MKRLLVYLLLLTALASCRSHREAARSNPPTAAEQRNHGTAKPAPDVIVPLVPFENHPQMLSANFRCTVSGIAVNGQLRMDYDSVIWVSVYKVVEVARIKATPSGVQGYSKIVGKYFDGTYDDIRRRWGIDVDYAMLRSILLGNAPAVCAPPLSKPDAADSVRYSCGHAGGATATATMVLSTSSRLLLSAEYASQSGGGQLRFAYATRHAAGGFLLPDAIGMVVRTRPINAETTLTLDKISIPATLGFPFAIPSGCKRL